MSSLEQALELIHKGERFLLTGHRRPDADALGSAVGLWGILRAIGKEAEIFIPENVVPRFEFLLPEEGVISELPTDAYYDATFVMDTAVRKLLPKNFPEPARSGPVVVIDHHYVHDDFGDVIVRDPDACATAAVVMLLAEALEVDPIPSEAATALYTGIVSDTGGFRYRSTSAEVLRMAARLVDAGADPARTARRLFEEWPREQLALLSEVLATLEFCCEGRVAILRITRDALKRAGASDDMGEGLVNYARRIVGVEVGVLLWEWPVGEGELETKVSLRSSGEADVSVIAVAIGGGGHRGAAAAQLKSDIEASATRVKAELEGLFL